jgi:hypothetical protein
MIILIEVLKGFIISHKITFISDPARFTLNMHMTFFNVDDAILIIFFEWLNSDEVEQSCVTLRSARVVCESVLAACCSTSARKGDVIERLGVHALHTKNHALTLYR